MDTIEQAIEQVKRGNTIQYELIIDHFQQQLYQYCYHILGNAHDAEDAVQDSLIKAYIKIKCYEENISFSAWLYKITYNTCINMIRRKKIIKFIPFLEENFTDNTDFQTNLETDDTSIELHQALYKISPLDRSIIILKIHTGLTFEEISSILNIKPATVRKKYERSRKKLKAILSQPKGGTHHEHYQFNG